jgi:lipopolysaccharide export system protein LptA
MIKHAFVGFSVTLALIGVPALSQAFKGVSPNQPVDVDADRIEVQDRADRAVFSGNVIAKQQGLSLTAERVTVAYTRRGGQGLEIDRLDASGGVNVTRSNESARGDFAIYDLNRRLITVLGNVELVQSGNRVQGARLVIDLDSGRSVIDGNGVGGSPGTTTDTPGRVTGHFTVPNRKP